MTAYNVECQMNRPSISCVCPTYGRVSLLEEAIECFLRQDYNGDSQLVIVNDLDLQELEIDNPRIKIINQSSKSLGEARNLSVENANYDLIANWDDDDIFLPNSLSIRMDTMRGEFSKVSKAFYSTGNNVKDITSNVYHSQAIFFKSLFHKIGGYPKIQCGEDSAFEDLIPKNLFNNHEIIDHKEIHYIYRWGGPFPHTSGYGAHITDVKSEMRNHVIRKINEGSIPSGKVTLKPKWDRDYVIDVENFLKERKD